MLIEENLQSVLNETAKGNDRGEKITLVGATKTVPADVINLAITKGLTVVAENKVQEFNLKHDHIIGAEQHFIGHLQTNKVKYIVGKVSLIHSADSLHIIEAISDCALKKGVTQDVLLEVNIGKEPTKSGFLPEEVYDAYAKAKTLNGVRITGLMAMLPKSDDEKLLAALCLQMRDFFDTIKQKDDNFKFLSMGMSEDYGIAIKNGSNMIRLGSYLFGKRNYGDKQNGTI